MRQDLRPAVFHALLRLKVKVSLMKITKALFYICLSAIKCLSLQTESCEHCLHTLMYHVCLCSFFSAEFCVWEKRDNWDISCKNYSWRLGTLTLVIRQVNLYIRFCCNLFALQRGSAVSGYMANVWVCGCRRRGHV